MNVDGLFKWFLMGEICCRWMDLTAALGFCFVLKQWEALLLLFGVESDSISSVPALSGVSICSTFLFQNWNSAILPNTWLTDSRLISSATYPHRALIRCKINSFSVVVFFDLFFDFFRTIWPGFHWPLPLSIPISHQFLIT